MRATHLDDLNRVLSPEPLVEPEELAEFYRDEVNAVRGDDKVLRFVHRINGLRQGEWFKTFLLGHPGVGKSTELTRLAEKTQDRIAVVRFAVDRELTPTAFQPFDLLLLMVAELVERTAEPVARGGAGARVPDALIERLWRWFSTENYVISEAQQLGAELAAGAGAEGGTWWAKALGLFASLKGEMRYASERRREVVEHRLLRISELMRITNEVIDACNRLLRQATGREWLFVGENFDKSGVPEHLVRALFVDHGNLFHELRAHLMFTLPVGLAYSGDAAHLPLEREVIADTPVYDAAHRPHRRGRQALRAVLDARLDPSLLVRGQGARLGIASGGNLRDLFRLAREAGENAALRGAERIGAQDVRRAIAALRLEYRRRLGQSPYDRERITYDDKVACLRGVYAGDPEASVPNPVLHALLRARAVQEFNGEGWFGVHPLVVDLLAEQGHLSAEPGTHVLGGST